MAEYYMPHETRKTGAKHFRVLFRSVVCFQRELEHERLIEAYREKMLLYDDLSALRKEVKVLMMYFRS
ncbi:hypothetical protein Y032_0466g1983 [Ancylostoma ceylanicum]|nr:hypothetical protein Y032_0466g1983 [Ancylostoma ceylanicum]